MKTVPISGTQASVSFYEDDSIETVRQLLALEVELQPHPDRLFVEVRTTLPAEYYASNPVHWMDLFARLSYDGVSITEDALKTYVTQIRLGTGFVPRAITKEEWERQIDVDALLTSESDFFEWQILGVPLAQSIILPTPPRDVSLQSARIPIPQPKSLFDTVHPFPVAEFRVTQLDDSLSDVVKRTFFPLLQPTTPPTLDDTVRTSLAKSQAEFGKLLALPATPHDTSAIVKAKWYIPLVSTRIPAPRSRFEQIFYGMTMSKTTPHIAYFTAKTETVRHKFYVEDPVSKTPVLDTSLVKGWYNKTQPQRRRPTLLLYRGKNATHFDRIAITDIDITVDVRREKSSKASLEDLKSDMRTWMESLDALVPFLAMSDIDLSRWELSDLSLIATYSKEHTDFDMRRIQCLRSIVGVQNDVFRVLRADQSTANVPAPVLQAYQVLAQEGAVQTPEYLAEELSIPLEDAQARMNAIEELSADVNFDQVLRSFPTLKFTSKEVMIRFVTKPERMLKYADLVRYVLTTDSDAVNDVCPRRMEEVAPQMVIPQQELKDEDVDVDVEILALLGIDEEAPAPAVAEAPAQPKARMLKVGTKSMKPQTYFNDRLKQHFPETFDQSFYPKKCEKRQQVVVLSTEDQARIPPEYNYSTAPDSEVLPLETNDGVAICPPFWCMRDEIPLREDQLKTGSDGELHCPVCDGKVRPTETSDPTEYPVIRRDATLKYPDFLKKESTINKKKVPCCYVYKRPSSKTISSDEDLYILREELGLEAGIPGLRFAYLSEDLASRLHVKTNYETTTKKGYLVFGESDVFRIGLGRPSETLPILFDEKTPIPNPVDAPKNVMKCSFFRTWRTTEGEDESQTTRLIKSINTAFKEGRLTKLQELEYVTTFLQCEVILIDAVSNQVTCGFWSDTLGANSRTIAILGNDILGLVRRKRVGKNYKTEFTVDLRKPPFAKATWPELTSLHKQACSIGVPTFDDAVAELQRAGKTTYELILDPFGRTQALFVPGDVLLPILPTSRTGARARSGYSDVLQDEYPERVTQTVFLESCRHPGYALRKVHSNQAGKVVELEVAAGFRIPVRVFAEEPATTPTELIETVRAAKETTLVDGTPNAADTTLAESISYASEMYEFLMYSLSRDIQTDEYETLRRSIATRSPTLLRDLTAWFKAEAYEDTTKSPVEFVNKVRTPCGQYKDKDTCNKSTLCGWRKNDCRIRVKPIVKKEDVLKRMVKTLRDNDKQRALVLDARLSPFFSTILYLEMPNEVILTSL